MRISDWSSDVCSSDLAALAEGRSSVLPLRLRMTQKLTVDADAVPEGETVRAWIPYPQALPGHQEDIRFVASEPAAHEIAPESAPQRPAHFEQPATAGEPPEFTIPYTQTTFVQTPDHATRTGGAT